MYQKGLTGEQNLQAIGNLAPYSAGGVGFDNRYEGVKGSSRLFEKLLPSFLKVKGQDYYLQLETDIDLATSTLIFIHPKTGKMLSLPAGMVTEVVIKSDGIEQIFRTTTGSDFEKGSEGQRFFQVLKDGKFQFIKVPSKKFIEADYKGVYTADRRYDEYETKYKYYIIGNDSAYHKITLNKKSLMKLFPDKKELINSIIGQGPFTNDEEMVISVLEKF